MKVVFKAGVAGAGSKQQMHAVPQKVKGRAVEREAGQDAGVVIQVLDGVHAKASKRFDVCVAVVEGMREGEQGLEV